MIRFLVIRDSLSSVMMNLRGHRYHGITMIKPSFSGLTQLSLQQTKIWDFGVAVSSAVFYPRDDVYFVTKTWIPFLDILTNFKVRKNLIFDNLLIAIRWSFMENTCSYSCSGMSFESFECSWINHVT